MRIITALLIGILGLALGIGGAWLLNLEGSWYYFGAGIALLVCCVLILFRSSFARPLYAALLLATLAWALWEVGLDWWPLGARGGLLVLLGLWLLTSWSVGDERGWGAGKIVLAGVLVIAIGVAGASMFRSAHEIDGNLQSAEASIAPPSSSAAQQVPDGEWHHWGRTLFGQRYSPLRQITSENVARLQVAWIYRTGDIRSAEDVPETTYQVTPLKIGNLLYLCTPHHLAIALDAATGKERWRFDPKVGLEKDRQHQTCRGVSYFRDGEAASGGPCAERVYLPTSDARLIALDALRGEPCPDFGNAGTVDLWANMPNQKKGYYYATSPPVVARGLVIIGGAVNDNYAMAAPSGVIRAYDARTGALRWNWDSGNPDRTEPLAPGETYTQNSPNSWSVASTDETLGLLYVPLGNATPDQLGMGRSEAVERFSSSITALDLDSGKVRWVRQTVHHDLWDMDVPAQPVLIDLQTSSGPVPALVGPTKQGDIYVLDRRSGEPIIAVREVPAPGGAIPEDFTAKTQPVSELSFSPPPMREADMWGVTLLDQMLCRIHFRSLRYEGRYTPPSLQGTLVYPGNFGVFNWGSVAVDPQRQIMFAMPTYLAFTSRLIPSEDIGPGQTVNTGEAGLNLNIGGKYGVIMQPFISELGLPCQAPPWGYVAGVDLRSGKIVWRHKNGTVGMSEPLDLRTRIGVPGLGGPLLTAGGIAILGATIDNYLRAYDVTSGRVLWEHLLPAGGQSTPMTYEADGRQFIVHVAGGHGSIGTKAGDFVIAYTLMPASGEQPAR